MYTDFEYKLPIIKVADYLKFYYILKNKKCIDEYFICFDFTFLLLNIVQYFHLILLGF